MTGRTRNVARHLRRAALAAGLAALLVVPSAGPATSANELEVQVRPSNDGDTAVHAGQTVEITGTSPDDHLGAARLVGFRADGTAVGAQRVDGYTLNAEDPGDPNPVTGYPGDYLRSDGGELSGRLTLFCLFGQPDPGASCPAREGSLDDVRTLRLEITAGGTTAWSPPLRVDYTRPLPRNASLVARDRVVFRFTEPVRNPDLQQDLPADWVVTLDGRDVPVAAVEGARPDDCVGHYAADDDASAGRTGCSRTLVLGERLDEDAQPLVEYVPGLDHRVPGRTAYEDFASNRAFSVDIGAKTAVDTIRPPTPRIESLAGKAPADGAVAANDETPTLVLSNLKAGHRAVVRTTRGGSTTETAPVEATGETVEVVLTALGPDGDVRVEAVVLDPHGNASTDSGEPARADAAPSAVTYGLDTAAPFLLGALADPDGRLTVTVSEDVQGADDAAHWTLQSGRDVTAVSGSGALRRLTVEDGAAAGDVLTYAPAEGRYADRAGNPVADRSVPVSGVPAPVVLQPAGPLYTAEPTARVAGSARDGDTVEVFADDDRDGTPDGAAVATAGVTDERWAASVELARNTASSLLVQATGAEGRSPLVTVPVVTHDDVAPAVDVLAPAAGAVLAGGTTTEVEWRTSDDNLADDATVVVELSTDGGQTYEVVEPAAAAEDGSASVLLPAVATDAAKVRVRVADRAGNVGAGETGLFTIDATAPVFAARTVAVRQVEVTFSEPVSGPLGADWRVAGAPAVVESADGQSGLSAEDATVLLLRTTADFDPDAEPQVTYAPGVTGELTDAAGQGVPAGLRTRTAEDRIRPATPTVTAVDGSAPSDGSVLGNEPRPVVALSGLRADNEVLVVRGTEDGAVAGPRTTAGGDTAEATAPLLPADGAHGLTAVAVDPNGNWSTHSDLNPPSQDGSPSVTYVLDTVVPALVSADPEGDDVVVQLSEDVTGPDEAADWSVTTASGDTLTVSGVSGSGATRVLSVEGGRPDAGTVRYAAGDTRYADAAGNPVADRALVVGGVALPVVVTPSVPRLTSADEVTVTGQGENGLVVELLREGEDAVLGTATVSAGWSVTAGLQRDAENRFAVRALDPETGERSPTVPVPPVTQDSTAPALEVREPGGDELYAGGADAVVRWATSDAHQAPDGIALELTLDGGATWTSIDDAVAPGDDEGSYEFEVPARSTDAAQVRVTATDLAGNARSVTTPSFRIDAVLPQFAARTLGEREVLVRFSEPVHGSIAPGDFLVDEAPAVVESSDGDTGAAALSASGVRELRLRTATAIGPNDRPTVRYAPSPAGSATDEAGNPIDPPVVLAADGIVPAAPTVTMPEGTVYEADVRRAFAGRSELGTSVRLLAEDGSPASSRVGTDDDGGWRAVGSLRRDTTVRLRAVAVDDAGNTSPLTAAPHVVQDSLAPEVRVGSPTRGQQLPLDTDVPVRWQVRDANLADDSVRVEVTVDGGETWTELARGEDASGSTTWRTPAEPTSTAAVRVQALDLAGRTGSTTEGWIGVGAAASGSTPPPSGGSGGSGGAPSTGAPGDLAAEVEYTLPDRVRSALPRTGAELLRVVLFGITALLTGAGFLLAGRNARSARRRRAA